MLFGIISVLIVIIDFVTKRIATEYLTKVDTIPIINDIFHLTYLENRGAAFGILQNQRWIFITLTFIVIFVIIYLMYKQRYKNALLKTGLAFVVGGAVGNLIDRVGTGFVVDFFDFRIINFPVFNVADVFVCVGGFLIALFYVFIYREEEKK